MTKIDIDSPAAVAERTERRLKAAYNDKAPVTVDTITGTYILEKTMDMYDPKDLRKVYEEVDAASGRGGQVKMPGADISKVPEAVGGEQRRQELANLQVAPPFQDATYARIILNHINTVISAAGKTIGQVTRDLAQV